MADWTLTVYGDDDTTPLFAVGTNPAHANPYLQVPGEFSAAEVDLQNGRAHIGFGSVVVIDPQTGATQQDRWLTERLGAASGHSALIRRRAVLVQDTDVPVDGIISGVTLNDTFAGFTLALADIRDRGVDVPAFVRTTTCSVLPRGVIAGYGRLPNGEWAAPPVTPLRATWQADPANPFGGTSGTFSLGAIRPETVLTEAMREAVRQGDATYYEPLGRYTNIRVLWRPVGGTTWTEIERPSAKLLYADNEVGPFIVGTGKIGVDDHEYVRGIRVRSPILGPPLPTNGQQVEVVVGYIGEPSERYPLHWEGTAGELAVALMRGDFSDTDPRLRYDEAAWLVLTAPARVRMTKRLEDVRTALEQLCKMRGCAPGLNAAGQIVPVIDALPPQDATLPQVDETNCTAAAGWDHPASGAVTAVEVRYHRDYPVGADRDPSGRNSAGDGIASREITIRHQADPAVTQVMGAQDVLEIDAWAFRALGTPDATAASGDVQDEVGAQLAARRARLCIDRFSYGAQSGYVRLMRSDFPGLKLGDWLIDARSWVPNYVTGQRGGNALAQVVSIQRSTPAWIEARIVYAGPADWPLSAPTFGTPTTDDDSAAVPVTAIPSIAGGPQVYAEVEYAIDATQPTANSGLWTWAGRTDAPGDIVTSALPSGATVWLRGRAVAAGVRPSAWVGLGSVTIAVVPRVHALSLAIAPDGAVTVSGRVNAATAGVRITPYVTLDDTLLPNGPSDWSAANFTAGVTLPDVVVPPDWSVTVDVEPWTGWTGSAVSGTPGAVVSASRVREVTDEERYFLALSPRSGSAEEVRFDIEHGPGIAFIAYWLRQYPWPSPNKPMPANLGLPDDLIGTNPPPFVTVPVPATQDYRYGLRVTGYDAAMVARATRELYVDPETVALRPSLTVALVDGTRIHVGATNALSVGVVRRNGNGWTRWVNGTAHTFDLSQPDPSSNAGIGASDTWVVDVYASDQPAALAPGSKFDTVARTVSGAGATEPTWLVADVAEPPLGQATVTLSLRASAAPTDYSVRVRRNGVDITADLVPVPDAPPTTLTQYADNAVAVRTDNSPLVNYRYDIDILSDTAVEVASVQGWAIYGTGGEPT